MCSFKFWTCNNNLIFCFISMFIFSAFSNIVHKTLYFTLMISDDTYFGSHPPPPPPLQEKTSKCAMFHSTCLSCFQKQILRPLFPWLVSVYNPCGCTCNRIFFFFNWIFPSTSLLENKVMGWLEIYLLKT